VLELVMVVPRALRAVGQLKVDLDRVALVVEPLAIFSRARISAASSCRPIAISTWARQTRASEPSGQS
jgi:hypothetical protein